DLAKEAMFKEEYFAVDAYESEFRGIVDGCAEEGFPEITMEVLYDMHVIPDISEVSCSLFAAWGAATEDGHLFQLRNLDWSMDAYVQNYPVVAIYEPADGVVHGVVGFAGMIGAIAGMNAEGIAQSEIMGHFCDAESLDGVPMPILLREVLYHDASLAAALTRMEDATRTNEYHYCIGDGLSTEPGAELLFTSATRFDRYAGGEEVDPHPCFADDGTDPFHTPLPEAVYWRKHNGSGNNLIYDVLLADYGSINHLTAIDVAQAAGVSGTVMSVVYDATALEFWVAFAHGMSQPAHLRAFVNIPLERGFGECVELDMTVEGEGTTSPPEGIQFYETGSLVAVEATQEYAWIFDHWEGDLTGDENPTFLFMDSHKSVKAVFVEATSYTLTMAVSGSGTVNPPAGVHNYYDGETVPIEATPDPGWALDHWEGDLTGSENPTTFTMDGGNATITAVFLPVSLSVNPPALAMVQEGGPTGFLVQNAGAGRMSWTVSESCDWVTLLPTLGELSGVGADPVAVSCLANMGCLPRVCTITVTAPDATESPIEIELIQAPNTTPSLVVSTTEFAAHRDAGTASFSILNGGCGTLNWSVAESCDWISVSPTDGISGAVAEEVEVSFTANPTLAPRECVLTVSAGGAEGSPVEVLVTQARGIAPELEVTPSGVIEVPPQAGSTSLTVKNVGGLILNWSASSTGSWLGLAPTAGVCAASET
ncbi:MAG: BACON domain-containing protein, partial [bacterium]|nr:BACON domain-containing protein [bacterium]